MFSGLCDAFDGKVARTKKNRSDVEKNFGIQIDSLTDVVAFGVLPACIGYAMLRKFPFMERFPLISVFFAIMLIYMLAAMIRLAYFNVMEEERQKLSEANPEVPSKLTGSEIEFDPFGFCVFSIVAVLGIIIGSFKFKNFSLTTTGGCLILALVIGHFTKFGNVSFMPKESTLKIFRELGLMLFLIGAGVAGGASFVKYFKWVYFIYGIVMTLLPMIIGYIFAKFALKLNLLNNLGSICGGMTSTPALGTLIQTAGTEKVAGAYASTYPIALIAVVIVSQVLIIIFR